MNSELLQQLVQTLGQFNSSTESNFNSKIGIAYLNKMELE